MRNCQLLTQFIVRSPFYSYRHGEINTIGQLVSDPFFRAAIYLASNSLYHELKKQHFEVQKLSPRVIHSLKKYANRMTYRTTPFGACSSFSFIEASGDRVKLVLNTDSFKMHLFPDYLQVLKAFDGLNKDTSVNTPMIANQSLYFTARDIRYLYFEKSKDFKRSYFIGKIERDSCIARILLYCQKQRHADDIIAFMTKHFDLDTGESKALLHDLRLNQILLPALRPGLSKSLPAAVFNRLLDIEQKSGCLTDQAPYNSEKVLDLKEFVNLPVTKNIENDIVSEAAYYGNLERSMTGDIPETVKNNLADALQVLEALSGKEILKTLSDFKKAFRTKFEGQAVPLLFALDPETGISYGDLTHADTESLLLADVDFEKKKHSSTSINWESAHAILLNKWPANGIGTIDLEESDLIKKEPFKGNVPPSFSIVFKIVGPKLLIEQAGGSSATALMGRFSLMSDAVRSHCLSIADREQRINDKVIFAEINYVGGEHTDNVSRREPLRDYEIPIHTGSSVPADKQIKLSELMINLEGDEILLWSKKLKKRIIPRLSSALNFTRSNLAVFRFLADLQYQNIQGSWGLDLTKMFPGLSCYPRITYKHCILFPSTWKLTRKSLHDIVAAPACSQDQAFSNLASKIGLPRYFALTMGDRFLAFDLLSPESIKLLLAEIQGMNEFTLRELLMENLGGGTVTDKAGNTYANELITSVINNEEVYSRPYKKPKINSISITRRKYLPESEWLYFKIYCPSFKSNLIIKQVHELLSNCPGEKKVRQWFFVRFNDPSYHLRIRINVPPAFMPSILGRLQKLWSKLRRQQIIENSQMETYVREIERYGDRFIEPVENIFYHSSLLVAEFLKQQEEKGDTFSDYKIAVTVTYDLLRLYISNDAQRLNFIAQIKSALFEEYGGSRELNISLDQKKRALKTEIAALLQFPNFYRNHGVYHHAGNLFKALEPLKQGHHRIPEQRLADIIHMHINRVFWQDMRKQELLVYILIHQFELSRQKRNLSLS